MEDVLQNNKTAYTRFELFNVWQLCGQTASEKSQTLLLKIISSFDEETLRQHEMEIRNNVRRFCNKLSTKWRDCNRTEERFLKNNEVWLLGNIILLNKEEEEEPQPSTSSTVGRPSLRFLESSERSKRRKTKELRESSSPGKLSYAMKSQLRLEGKHDAAKLVAEATESSPSRASKIRKAWEDKRSAPTKISPDEALSLIVDAKLTKAQYTKIRLMNKEKGANIYPTYNNVRKAKELCYPSRSQENVTISELSAEIKLQSLLDHTAQRILLAQEEVVNTISMDEISSNFTLLCKWGCDGSTGHSEYKQILEEGHTDTDIFMISFVPLQLHANKRDDGSKLILWQNPRPSSVRYCRPIEFLFQKETTKLSQQQIEDMESEIKSLIPFQTIIKEKEISINYHMSLTMVDGKICNAATSTSSAQTCYLCKATPKEMNLIDKALEKPVDPDAFKFGLSTLHAWIRFFECFLHIAYRLDFRKWQARGENIPLLKSRKEEIQRKFRNEMGLLVDKVKPGGSGTSNDGNTARRFFNSAEKSAEITGINLNLLKRCRTILQAMSSGHRIDKDKLKEFCTATARLFVHEYGWYNMPASMHKILIHGAEVIDAAVLPIGQLSEEAQECRNKDLKMYRRTHTRKISRETTNEDLLHCLLVSSDPYLSSLRKLPSKHSSSMSAELLELLVEPEVPVHITKNLSELFSSEDTSEFDSSDEDF